MVFNKNGSFTLCLVGLMFGTIGELFHQTRGEETCEVSRVSFNQCKVNESCVSDGSTAYCKCKTDYEKTVDGNCHPVPKQPSPTPAPSTSTESDSGGFGFRLVLWLIVPVLLACAIAGVVYTGRQKLWLSRLYRMRIRSYNNVLVSSQDEDDPPIA